MRVVGNLAKPDGNLALAETVKKVGIGTRVRMVFADAAPGGIFEASAMGCNVVASPDCGFWELCHDDLLVPTPSAAAFLDRIELACAQPFSDHRDQFLGDTAELIETLAVF